jgi:hypothetical protein
MRLKEMEFTIGNTDIRALSPHSLPFRAVLNSEQQMYPSIVLTYLQELIIIQLINFTLAVNKNISLKRGGS